MLTTFKDLLWKATKAQKVHMEANLPFINSTDTKLMYYTVVHKCFEYYLSVPVWESVPGAKSGSQPI